MKRLLLIMGIMAIPWYSQAEISGSAHDFSVTGWAEGELCLPCHTPHFSNQIVDDAPLWNHAVTTATFTTYTSPTLNAAVAPPTNNSQLCLSCHDGTVALDSYGGVTGATNISARATIGTNIGDDHPVAFVYDSALAAADGELVDPAVDGDTNPDTVGVAGPYLPLFGGQMECSTCHDVHNGQQAKDNPQLLLLPKAGSQLCLNCHKK